MIANDDELKGTQARIKYFEDLLAQLRVSAAAELFPSMARGYRSEIEKMQTEVLEYLTRHVCQLPRAQPQVPEATCSVHLSERDAAEVMAAAEKPPAPNAAALQAARWFIERHG